MGNDHLTCSQAIERMRYEMHPYPTTRSPCSRGCGRSARGGGVCFNCATDDLASHCGRELAFDMADALSKYRECHEAIQNELEEGTATDDI